MAGNARLQQDRQNTASARFQVFSTGRPMLKPQVETRMREDVETELKSIRGTAQVRQPAPSGAFLAVLGQGM